MAAESAFPESYKDPLYARLDASNEQKLGLPAGLLSSVRVNGEASNHSATNEQRTFSVYQFTPATRKAILDKYGLDVTLSPQNASEGAGLLLKEGMQRSGGDPAQAVAQYTGGTDPKNWGKATTAYVQRVMSGTPQQVDSGSQPRVQDGVTLPPMQGPSTFDRAMQQMQAQQAPNLLQMLHQAYTSGEMSPQEEHDYEADVRSGKMLLPAGASLKSTSAAGPVSGGAGAATTASDLPPQILQAYQAGQMSPSEAADLQRDVRAGAWSLPAGMTADSLFGASRKPAGMVAGLTNAVTGNDRKTASTQSLPEWTGMPEMNQLSGSSFMAGLGTLLAPTAEIPKVIQAQYPGVQVRHDEKGNAIMRSSINGQDYVIPPGVSWGDVPRILGGLAAFTPAGRATTLAGGALANAGTQAAIEGVQALAGGNVDPESVARAGVLGAVVPTASRVLGFVAQPAKAAISRALGRAEPAVADARAAATPGGAAEAPSIPQAQTQPVAPVASSDGAAPALPTTAPAQAVAPAAAAATPAAAQGATVDGVAAAARTAAQKGAGSDAARQLAAIAAPNQEAVAAADRLGVSGALQPDHVTTNDAYRQTVAILKSANPVSQLSQSEKAGLEQVSKRASALIDEIGGTTDLSTLDSTVKARMQSTRDQLATRENALWGKLREAIPATTETPATSTLDFLQQRTKELGGAQNLSPFERMLLSKLTPKAGADVDMLNALGPAARQQATAQGVQGATQPTYALVDNLRQQAGRRSVLNGAFSDADTGLAKKLYGLLSTDQEAAANSLGQGDLAAAAKAATVTRKGMEDDLSALFGDRLEKSLVPSLSGAIKAAGGGTTEPMLAILKSTPDSMKQEVVASGLASVFRNAGTRGEINFTTFSKWFEGLQRNKQAYAAVMSNLPTEARQQIVDLARVSKGISDSLGARIGTGRLSTVVDQAIQAPDTLASRLFDLAKHAGKGLAADAIGGHGAGLTMGLISAIRGAKPDAMKAIDQLLTSPEFKQLAIRAGTPQEAQASRVFANSGGFSKLVRALGNPSQLSNKERWVLQALQTRNNVEPQSRTH